MATTTATKQVARAIVTAYAARIRAAEKEWDINEVTRLLVERNAELATLRSR